MKVKDILSHLDFLFPIENACDFDNVGLLVGEPDKDVSRVLIALDCTTKTIENAKANKCELIITHHPIIFEPLKNVLKDSLVYKLIENGISVISMHTNLDVSLGGVNSCLCDALGLNNVSTVTADSNFELMGGFTNAPISSKDFAENIKHSLNTRVKYVDSSKAISKVLVCSGSGGEFINEAIKLGFQALVTSDIKHHQFLIAKENNVSLFDAGHFETEDIVIEPLKSKLQDKFKDIEFITEHPQNIKYC